jgi:hypothetical protein
VSSEQGNDWEIKSIQMEALPLLPGSALRARFIEKATLVPPGDDESGDACAEHPIKEDYFGP